MTAEAVDRLYEVFARYRLRPSTEACPCCVSDEAERALHARPLRDLRGEDVGEFASCSLLTWGELVDVKRFLPRVLELTATGAFPDGDPDAAVVIGVLRRGDWRTWPADEQTAVEAYLQAWWRSTLEADDAPVDVGSLVAAVATVDNVQPYLDAWLDLDGTAPAVHFAEFLQDNVTNAALGRHLAHPCFADDPAAEADVRTWLLSAASGFVPRLEAAFLAASDENTLRLLAAALDSAKRL